MRKAKKRYSNTIIASGKRIEFIPYKKYRTPAGGYYQGMSPSAYWKQRNKERISEAFEKADELKRYERDFYEKELRKVVEEYKTLIEPYISNGEFNPPVGDSGLEYKMRRLFNEIDTFTAQLNKEQVVRLEELLMDVYITNGKAIIADLDMDEDLYLFNENAVKQAIRNPWTRDGREFSDRIWQNTEALNRGLRNTLTNAIARGEAPNRTIREFKRLFGNSSYNTARIILTETSAIYNKSAIDTYKEAGLNEFEVIGSAADGSCSPFVGKRLKVAEAKVGITAPPYHPFCKCCVAPVVNW